MAEEGDRFPYEKLWDDNKLTGLVIVGSNTRDYSESTLSSYLEFMRSRGYEFEGPREEDNTKGFVERLVSSGELYYFIKEAHSDGDEKNLFRMNIHSRIVHGVKKQVTMNRIFTL